MMDGLLGSDEELDTVGAAAASDDRIEDRFYESDLLIGLTMDRDDSDGQRRSLSLDDDGGAYFNNSHNLVTVVRKGEAGLQDHDAERSPIIQEGSQDNDILFDPTQRLNFDDTETDEDNLEEGKFEAVGEEDVGDDVPESDDYIAAQEVEDEDNSDSMDGSNYLDHRPRVNGSDLVEDGAVAAAVVTSHSELITDQGQNIRIIEGHDSSLQDDGNIPSIGSGNSGLNFDNHAIQLPSLSSPPSSARSDYNDDDESDEDGQNLYDSLDPGDGTSSYGQTGHSDINVECNMSEYYTCSGTNLTGGNSQSHSIPDSYWLQDDASPQLSRSSSNHAHLHQEIGLEENFASGFQAGSFLRTEKSDGSGDDGICAAGLQSNNAPESQDGFELCEEGLLQGTQMYAQPGSNPNQSYMERNNVTPVVSANASPKKYAKDFSVSLSVQEISEESASHLDYRHNSGKDSAYSSNMSSLEREVKGAMVGGSPVTMAKDDGGGVTDNFKDQRQAAAGSSSLWDGQNQSVRLKVRAGSLPRKRTTISSAGLSANKTQSKRPAVQGSASREVKKAPSGSSSSTTVKPSTIGLGQGVVKTPLSGSNVAVRTSAQGGDSVSKTNKQTVNSNDGGVGATASRADGSNEGRNSLNAAFSRTYQPVSRAAGSPSTSLSTLTSTQSRVSGVGKESHRYHKMQGSGSNTNQVITTTAPVHHGGEKQPFTSENRKLGNGRQQGDNKSHSVPSSHVLVNRESNPSNLVAASNSSKSTTPLSVTSQMQHQYQQQQQPLDHAAVIRLSSSSSSLYSQQQQQSQINSSSSSLSHNQQSHNGLSRRPMPEFSTSTTNTSFLHSNKQKTESHIARQQTHQQIQHNSYPHSVSSVGSLPQPSSVLSNHRLTSPMSPPSPVGSDHSFNKETVVSQLDFMHKGANKNSQITSGQRSTLTNQSDISVPGIEEVRNHLNSMLNLAVDYSGDDVDETDTTSELVTMDQPVNRQLQFDVDSGSFNGTNAPDDMSEILENFPTFSSKMFTEMPGIVPKTDSYVIAENQSLRDNLEKERYRRKHCEQQIQNLNSKLLETQQQLAVAVSTDKRKDLMIEQLDKQLAKVVEGWKKREADKDTLVKSLKEEKEHVEGCLHQHQSMISNFECELSQTVAELKEEKEKSSETIEHLRSELNAAGERRVECEARLSEAADQCSKMSEEWDELVKDKLNAEKLAQQSHDKLIEEQDKWRLKEADLVSKITQVKEANQKVINMEKVKMEEEKKKREDFEAEVGELKTELKKLVLDCEQLVREKESQKMEMSIMEAKFESSQRKLEADLHSQMEKEIADQAKDYHCKLETTMEEVSEKHRKQVGEVHARHKQDLENQMATAAEEMVRKEQEYQEMTKDYEDKLADQRNEISNLKQSKLKLESQRMEILNKLQFMMQSQWNEAVSLLVSTPQKRGLNSSFLSSQSMPLPSDIGNSLSLSQLATSSNQQPSPPTSSLPSSVAAATTTAMTMSELHQQRQQEVIQQSMNTSSNFQNVKSSTSAAKDKILNLKDEEEQQKTSKSPVGASHSSSRKSSSSGISNKEGGGGQVGNESMGTTSLQGKSKQRLNKREEKENVLSHMQSDDVESVKAATAAIMFEQEKAFQEDMAKMDRVEEYIYKMAIQDDEDRMLLLSANGNKLTYDYGSSQQLSAPSTYSSNVTTTRGGTTTTIASTKMISAVVHHTSIPSDFQATAIKSPKQMSRFWNDLGLTNQQELGSQPPPPSAVSSCTSLVSPNDQQFTDLTPAVTLSSSLSMPSSSTNAHAANNDYLHLSQHRNSEQQLLQQQNHQTNVFSSHHLNQSYPPHQSQTYQHPPLSHLDQYQRHPSHSMHPSMLQQHQNHHHLNSHFSPEQSKDYPTDELLPSWSSSSSSSFKINSSSTKPVGQISHSQHQRMNGDFSSNSPPSPPIKQRASLSRDDMETLSDNSSQLPDTARLHANYSHMSDQVDAHVNRQEELQHYIQMLLQKAPGTVENEPERDPLRNESDILESSRDLTVDLDLTETGQALEVTQHMNRLHELRERQQNSSRGPSMMAPTKTSRGPSMMAPTKTSKQHPTSELSATENPVLTQQNLIDISQMLSTYREQWETSPESAPQFNVAGRLVDALRKTHADGRMNGFHEKSIGKGHNSKKSKAMSKEHFLKTRKKIGYQPADGSLNASTDSGHNSGSGSGAVGSRHSGVRKGHGQDPSRRMAGNANSNASKSGSKSGAAVWK